VGGQQQLQYLCKMCGADSVETLPEIVTKLLIEAGSNEERAKLFSNAMHLTCTKHGLGEPPELLARFATEAIQSMWHMLSERSPTDGSLCNTFLWNGPKALVKEINKQRERGSKANVQLSMEQAKTMEKAPIFWSPLGQITTLLRMGHILWLTFTENPSHPVVTWLQGYQREFSNNLTLIEEYPCRNENKRDLLGIQVQIVINRHLTAYSKAATSNQTMPRLNPFLITETVTDSTGRGEHWEVIGSTMNHFKSAYPESLAAFRNAVSGRPSSATATFMRDDFTVAHATTASNFEGLQVGGPRPARITAERWSDDVSQIGGHSVTAHPATQRIQSMPRATTPTPGARGGGGGGRQEMTFNDDASADLKQLWRDSRAKCSTMKKAADTNRNGIPPLPRSKKDGCADKPICLNWHVLGECRVSGCEQGYDHIAYSEEELSDTKTWVRTHATRFEEDNRVRSRGGRGGRGGNSSDW
jgi:hypothetical protein